jgi:hypothetical protein
MPTVVREITHAKRDRTKPLWREPLAFGQYTGNAVQGLLRRNLYHGEIATILISNNEYYAA